MQVAQNGNQKRKREDASASESQKSPMGMTPKPIRKLNM